MINWANWLPPKITPTRKVTVDMFVPGQVWAERSAIWPDSPSVFSIVEIGKAAINVCCLAGATPSKLHIRTEPLLSAYLVQAVGQDEPTDPDIMWQFLYMNRK